MDFSKPLLEYTRKCTDLTQQVWNDPDSQAKGKYFAFAFTTGAVLSYTAFKLMHSTEAENQGRDDVAFNNRKGFNSGNPFINNKVKQFEIDSSEDENDSSSIDSDSFLTPMQDLKLQKQRRIQQQKEQQDELLLLKLKTQATQPKKTILYFDSNDEMYTEEQMLSIQERENKFMQSKDKRADLVFNSNQKLDPIDDLKKQLYKPPNNTPRPFSRKRFSMVQTDVNENPPSPTNKQDILQISEILQNRKHKSIKRFVKDVNKANEQEKINQYNKAWKRHKRKSSVYSDKESTKMEEDKVLFGADKVEVKAKHLKNRSTRNFVNFLQAYAKGYQEDQISTSTSGQNKSYRRNSSDKEQLLDMKRKSKSTEKNTDSLFLSD